MARRVSHRAAGPYRFAPESSKSHCRELIRPSWRPSRARSSVAAATGSSRIWLR